MTISIDPLTFIKIPLEDAICGKKVVYRVSVGTKYFSLELQNEIDKFTVVVLLRTNMYVPKNLTKISFDF